LSEFIFICFVLFIIFKNVSKNWSQTESGKQAGSKTGTRPNNYGRQNSPYTDSYARSEYDTQDDYGSRSDTQTWQSGQTYKQAAEALRKANIKRRENASTNRPQDLTAKDSNKARRSDWGAKSKDRINGKSIAALLGFVVIAYILSGN